MKKCFLKYFAKFTGKHLCQNLFFNKAAGIGTVAASNVIKLFESNFSITMNQSTNLHYKSIDCFSYDRNIDIKLVRLLQGDEKEIYEKDSEHIIL